MSKRHLASIYFEIDSDDPTEAIHVCKEVMESIADRQVDKTANFRIGGTAVMVPGDLLGNAQRAEKI